MKPIAGVIINAGSGRGNGKGLALHRRLEGSANIHLHLLGDFTALTRVLVQFASVGVSDLYISSGDGTIQAIQTLAAEQSLFKELPRLCLLPHGTTNLTGIDVGFKISSVSKQAEYIRRGVVNCVAKRHSLRVLNPRGTGPRHGMTLGAGAAATATRLAQFTHNDQGRTGQLAAFAVMASGFAKSIFAKPNHQDTARLDRPCPMTITSAGRVIADGPQLMFIATTLERQFFNARPFWGGKHGPIRASIFPYPAPNPLRWLVPLMYGGEDRKVPPGAASFSGNAFEIECEEPFVLDGEFFDGPTHGPLRVEAGPEFEFILG